MIVIVEGPAGSGKSTMARMVAAETDAVVIEGGVWYRALAYLALQAGLRPDQTPELQQIASTMHLTLQNDASGRTRVLSSVQDITDALYDDAVSAATAPYAQNLAVREVVAPLIIQEVRSHPRVIAVGRHLQLLFPDAPVLTLTIDPAEADRRAQRRSSQSTMPVDQRNATDRQTSVMLGDDKLGSTVVDVTHLTVDEQAAVLKQFIGQHAS